MTETESWYIGAIDVRGIEEQKQWLGNKRDEWDRQSKKGIKVKVNQGAEKRLWRIPPVLCQFLEDNLSYLSLCNKFNSELN